MQTRLLLSRTLMKTLVLPLFVLVVSACSRNEAPTKDIEKDLIGQSFFYKYDWGFGGQKWRVEPFQFAYGPTRIIRRFTDARVGTDEVYAEIALRDGTRSIKGVLVLSYKKYDQGWKLESVKAEQEKPGESFSLEIEPLNVAWTRVCSLYRSRLQLMTRLINVASSSTSINNSLLNSAREACQRASRFMANQEKAPETLAQMEQFDAAQQRVSQALAQLITASLDASDLRGNQDISAVLAPIETTENQLALERGTFNALTRRWDSDGSLRKPLFSNHP
jgi:hypothetical protein